MVLAQYIQRTLMDPCLELYPNKLVQTWRKCGYFTLHKLYFS